MLPPMIDPTRLLWSLADGRGVCELEFEEVWLGTADDNCVVLLACGRGNVREKISESLESLNPPAGALRVALPLELLAS